MLSDHVYPISHYTVMETAGLLQRVRDKWLCDVYQKFGKGDEQKEVKGGPRETFRGIRDTHHTRNTE